jgi:hypothetical protein
MELAFTTGLERQDVRELERILTRKDLLRLTKMFKDGKNINFADKR